MESLILHNALFFDKVLRNRDREVCMDENILIGKTLLVVDDETDLRDIVASELEYMGAKVFQAENIAAAQKVLMHETVDLIISDIRMPGGTGIDLLDVVKSKNVNVPPVILITGFADITTEDAFDKGAEALLNKPFKLDDLIKMVVRYTSPFDERFKEPVTSQKSILAIVNRTDARFGRGGVAIEVEMNGRKCDIGELVNFNFDYQDEHFAGSAVCRWFKQVDHGTNKAMIGLEFMNLNTQSLTQFQKLCEGKNIVPYIPAVKN
jgi:CheY-like chemotaxis protein